MTRDEKPITDKPYTTFIKSIVQDTPLIKTIFVDFVINGESPKITPGQFVLIWIPGIDEIPMAISFILDNGDIGFTVKDVGEATHALHTLKVGDIIGIRGPYGNGYPKRDGYSVIIGGGIGIASIRLLILQALEKRRHHLQVIIGAQTANELLYRAELEQILEPSQLNICTDDGSYGEKGFVTEILEQKIKNIRDHAGANPITVYACGPELMLKNLLKLS